MRTIADVKERIASAQNVVIVYPYTYVNPYSCLPPIAAEYLQAGVVAAGKQALLLDMRFEDRIDEKVRDADLVCLYGYFEDCTIFGRWGHHVIDRVLEVLSPETPVIVGGTGFSDPDAALETHARVDLVLRGSPDHPIRELLAGTDPEETPNVVYRTPEGVARTPRFVHPLSEDIYPRRELRNPRYRYHIIGLEVDLIRAGVGCNYRCRFCYQYGKDSDGAFLRWQGRSADSVCRELGEISAPVVYWIDDDMTTDMSLLDDIAETLIRKRIRKLYIGTGRLDHVLKGGIDTLVKLEKAGLLVLGFGVESLKQETLKFYGKGLTIERIEQAMEMMQKTNILLFCNFLFGSPGETEEDMMEYLWFGHKWGVDTLVSNRLRVQKGSTMHEAMYARDTGEPLPGMERITGKELERIKLTVKFAQRTPPRIALSFIKLYRHQGMVIDPLTVFCSLIETLIQGTMVERTKVVPFLLRLGKRVGANTVVNRVLRMCAIVSYPFVRTVDRLFQRIDRRFGISTKYVAGLFVSFKEVVYEKQKRKAQLQRSATGAGVASTNGTAPSGRLETEPRIRTSASGTMANKS